MSKSIVWKSSEKCSVMGKRLILENIIFSEFGLPGLLQEPVRSEEWEDRRTVALLSPRQWSPHSQQWLQPWPGPRSSLQGQRWQTPSQTGPLPSGTAGLRSALWAAHNKHSHHQQHLHCSPGIQTASVPLASGLWNSGVISTTKHFSPWRRKYVWKWCCEPSVLIMPISLIMK